MFSGHTSAPKHQLSVPSWELLPGRVAWDFSAYWACQIFLKPGLVWGEIKPSGTLSNHRLVVGEMRYTQAPLTLTTCSKPNWAPYIDSVEPMLTGTCTVTSLMRYQAALDIDLEPSSFSLLEFTSKDHHCHSHNDPGARGSDSICNLLVKFSATPDLSITVSRSRSIHYSQGLS